MSYCSCFSSKLMLLGHLILTVVEFSSFLFVEVDRLAIIGGSSADAALVVAFWGTQNFITTYLPTLVEQADGVRIVVATVSTWKLTKYSPESNYRMELACWQSIPAPLTRCNNEENCTDYSTVRARPSNLWFHSFCHTGYTVCNEGPRLIHSLYCSMVDNRPRCLDTHVHRFLA